MTNSEGWYVLGDRAADTIVLSQHATRHEALAMATTFREHLTGYSEIWVEQSRQDAAYRPRPAPVMVPAPSAGPCRSCGKAVRRRHGAYQKCRRCAAKDNERAALARWPGRGVNEQMEETR